MARSKPPRSARKKRRPEAAPSPSETPASDAATVAWTMATSTVLLCNLGAVAAHLLAANHPDARGTAMFRELLLFAGAAIGLVALVLTPVVYRVRRVPPPVGYSVFAVCVAVAPMLALAVRALR